jgi:hypothetical protein
MSNPFIEKAQKKQERARSTMNNHVRELHGLLKRIDSKGEPELHKRIEARLKEARYAAKTLE